MQKVVVVGGGIAGSAIAKGLEDHAEVTLIDPYDTQLCLQRISKKLLEAESVLIIGGGPVGVELAGEILTDFPQKKVTLVHSGDRLIEFLGPKASKKTEKWLRKKGADVILKDEVNVSNSIAPPDYETKKHVELKADAHFVAIGKKLGNRWIEASPFLKDLVTVEGRLRVEHSGTRQVLGFQNIFAAGDITDFKEIKQGYLAAKQAAVVVKNIKTMMRDPCEKKLAVYKVLATPIGIVSLGRVHAVAQLPFGTIIGRLAGLLKSKDLFVGKSREALGLKFK